MRSATAHPSTFVDSECPVFHSDAALWLRRGHGRHVESAMEGASEASFAYATAVYVKR
jgi:hypothetical protein